MALEYPEAPNPDADPPRVAESFDWNGARLTWRTESWPCFDNRDQSARPFFAKAFPVGTKWTAEIVADHGHVLFKTRSSSPQGTPVLALIEALRRLRAEFANVFGEVDS